MVSPVVGCAVLIAVLVFIVVAYRERWGWTGFVSDRADGIPDVPAVTRKSLWDWLDY